LLWSPDELEARGVTVHWTDRGGDVTYHGPGQLVGYPLLPLGSLNAEGRIPQSDYVGYIRKLETILMRSLDQLGVKAMALPGLTGAWIPQDEAPQEEDHKSWGPHGHRKIASIGVKVDSDGISRHGFALNVSPDMSYWKGIVACGLADYEAISMAELIQPPPTMSQVADVVKRTFADRFKYEIVEVHDDPVLDQLLSENTETTGSQTTALAY
jgi:lipoate-protein ligase B